MKTEEILELVFNKYWSQILLFLGGIGYLIKIKLDRKTKKIEIRSKIFYEKKIEYFTAYSQATIKTLNYIASTQYYTINEYMKEDKKEIKAQLNQIEYQEQILNFLNKKEALYIENIGEYLYKYNNQKDTLADDVANFHEFEYELNELKEKLIDDIRSELENLKYEIHNDFIKD